ncbi:MAG: M48 family metallopeptidase [Micavibrio sp.]
MKPSLYGLRNYIGIATHYSVMAGVAAAACALASPWVVGGAALFSTGYFWAQIKGSKEIMEETLQPHPENHSRAPRLGQIARELYKASGLNADKWPIYDFRAKDITRHDSAEQADRKREINKMLQISRFMPNAAALNLGKPVIMISEPLLELLNDDEEKAVLAHEFAHAGARHQHVTIPLKMTAAISRLTNQISLLTALFAGGVMTFLGGLGVTIGTAIVYKKTHPDYTSQKPETKEDREKSIRLNRNTNALAGLTGLAFFATVNPALAPLWASIMVLHKVSKVTEGGLSRSLEYQADKGAVKLGANPLALITSLRKLETLQERSIAKVFGGKENMPEKDFIDRAWARAISTHPTTKQRVGRLTELARKHGYSKEEILHATQGPLDLSPNAYIPFETIHKMASRITPSPTL